MEKRYYFKDNIGQDIYLTFCAELFSGASEHVLVVPICRGQLLFTCHKTRGWELPGGKVEPGETLEQAAVRETWEETGAILGGLEQIGEYAVSSPKKGKFRKAIFLAFVDRLEERPSGYETKGRCLFPVDTDTSDPCFSQLVKDQVFIRIQEFLRTRFPSCT
jgi:8-oxo-dGTP diphosphatase